MTNTVIYNKPRVHDAIVWCTKEFGINAFEIDNQFPSWNWKFKFKDPQQAVHFALKWA